MGTATFSNIQRISIGGSMACLATITGSSSYATGGDSIDISTLPFQYVDTINFSNPIASNEFLLQYLPTSSLIKTYTLSGTISGGVIANTTATNNTSAVSGTGTYTDAATSGALNIGTPVFFGTGQTSAGQVITTTDNQTMSLNQCAGMHFISATHGPYIIASNTAVAGAPAVLTIYGGAPTTDAGTYRIVRNITVGSVTALSGTAAAQIQVAHNHTISGLSGSAAIAEIANTTNLSGMTDTVIIFGHN